jgi:hypothetical protein
MILEVVMLVGSLGPANVPEAPPPADADPPVQRPADAGPPVPAENPATAEEDAVAEPVDEAAGPQPQPGWDDEPADAPATTVVEPGDLEPAPATSIDASVPAKPELPEVPTKRGTGMLAGAGAAGAAAIGFNIWRAIAFADICAVEDELGRAIGCTFGALAIFPLTATAWTGNLGSIGLAAAGGVMRGKYDALETIHAGEKPRSGIGTIAAGATLMGLGITAGIGVRAWLLSGDFFSGCQTPELEDCMRRRVHGYFAGLQLSGSFTAAGAGLLSYGVTLGKYKSRFAPHSFRLIPQITYDRVGLSLTGRF